MLGYDERMKTGRPDPTEHSPYFARYIDLATEDDIIDALEKQRGTTRGMFEGIDDKRGGYRYAPGKWSIKQVIGHMADSERVFAYRTLAISRGEKQSLPGFDEKTYVDGANFDSLSMRDLVENLSIVRAATLSLLRSLSPEAWTARGVANDSEVTPRALAYITLGHERHHLKVLKEKYGL